MRILTWNINSVRLRAPQVLDVMQALKPDIIALQETKCPDDVFPEQAFIEAGYPYIHKTGMKSYNGVAFIARTPFVATQIWERVGRHDCRHAAIEIKTDAFAKPLQIHNLYVPAGGDIPDITLNDKFAHKLDFVSELTEFFTKNYKDTDPLIALGDFNIAPLEHDVWSHKQLLNVVSHTPIEVEHLTAMQQSLNWVDTTRHFVPENEKCYSWWSYRNRDWKASNRGRRLDHIWATPALKPHLKSQLIFKDSRDWLQPSDHVPVMLELENL